MRKSRKVILKRDQMMEHVIDGFIMKLDTEEEAVYLDREDPLSEKKNNIGIQEIV